jgi:hypothetical protein
LSTEIGVAPSSLATDLRAVAVRGSPAIAGPGPPAVAVEDLGSLHATLQALASSARRALARARDPDNLRELDDLAWRLDRLRDRLGPGPRLEPIRRWAENLRRLLRGAAGIGP